MIPMPTAPVAGGRAAAIWERFHQYKNGWPSLRSHALRHSLLARVLTSTLALAALTVLGLTSLFLWTYSRDLQSQVTGRAEAMAGFLAGQSQFAMLVGDRGELERLARNAVLSDQVLLVELRDAEAGDRKSVV